MLFCGCCGLLPGCFHADGSCVMDLTCHFMVARMFGMVSMCCFYVMITRGCVSRLFPVCFIYNS